MWIEVQQLTELIPNCAIFARPSYLNTLTVTIGIAHVTHKDLNELVHAGLAIKQVTHADFSQCFRQLDFCCSGRLPLSLKQMFSPACWER